MFGYRVTLSYDNTFHNEQQAVFCDTLEQCEIEALKFLKSSISFMKLDIALDLGNDLTFYENSLITYCRTYLESGVKQYVFKSAIIKIDSPMKSRPGYLLKVYEGDNIVFECCYKGVNGKKTASRDFKQYIEHLTTVYHLTFKDRDECLLYMDNARKEFKKADKLISIRLGSKLVVLKKAE